MVFRDVAKDGTTRLTGGILNEGPAGPAGRGIIAATIRYQASSSGTVIPTGTWVSSPPATTAGQYLWTRTVLTYTDATTSTSYSVARHGLTGNQGPQGSRWGTTDQWLFAGVTNVPVAFQDGQPPRVGDWIISTNPFGTGDLATVVSVVDATHANLQFQTNIRGPKGDTGSLAATGHWFGEGSPSNPSIFSGGSITVAGAGTRLHISGFVTCYIASTPGTRSVHLTVGSLGTYPIGGYFFNETASHKPIPVEKVITGVPAGTYALSASFAGLGVAVDANDYYKVTVREF